MKKYPEIVESYIREMSVWDFALVKVCLCAAGILLGLAIPKKGRKGAAFVFTAVFSAAYIAAMLPFLKKLESGLVK